MDHEQMDYGQMHQTVIEGMEMAYEIRRLTKDLRSNLHTYQEDSTYCLDYIEAILRYERKVQAVFGKLVSADLPDANY